MEQIKAKVKKWGNSFGIVLPMNLINSEKIKEGNEVNIFVEFPKKTRVKDVFGILKGKLKKDTQEALDEIDKELWPEDA